MNSVSRISWVKILMTSFFLKFDPFTKRIKKGGYGLHMKLLGKYMIKRLFYVLSSNLTWVIWGGICGLL